MTKKKGERKNMYILSPSKKAKKVNEME